VTASAGAATSFTQNDTFSFPLSPGSQNVSFDAFRSIAGWNSDWQLQSVELNFDITISGDVTAENDSALNAPDFGLTLNGSATVQFDSLFGFAAINSVAASGPLSATDGVDGSGSDFFDFGTVSDSFLGSDSAVGSPAVDPFDVAGTIDAVVNANAAFGFTGTTDATLIVSNLAASGNLEVIYNYVVVPAPGTAMTMGVVGLAALRRRR
jgi:hypothetical protein